MPWACSNSPASIARTHSSNLPGPLWSMRASRSGPSGEVRERRVHRRVGDGIEDGEEAEREELAGATVAVSARLLAEPRTMSAVTKSSRGLSPTSEKIVSVAHRRSGSMPSRATA